MREGPNRHGEGEAGSGSHRQQDHIAMAYVQMSRYPNFRGFIQKIKFPDENGQGRWLLVDRMGGKPSTSVLELKVGKS